MAVRSFFRGFAEKTPVTSNESSHEFGDVSVILPGDMKRRLEVLEDIEQAGIGWLWASDADGRLIYISENAVQTLGKPLETLLAQSLTTLFETDPYNPGERSDRPLAFQLSARNKITDLTVRFAPGRAKQEERQTWWSISGHPKYDADGEFIGYRGSAKDITVEYERQLEDSRLAEFDSLTGLANRHRMNRKLESTLAAFKAAKRSCTLMMLDLDRFKHVNDTLGHQAGDELLKQVAERLGRIIGDRGEIGRLGGDEFQIILPDLDDRGKLGDLATKLIQIVSLPYALGDERAIIGTSVGLAIAPYDGLEKKRPDPQFGPRPVCGEEWRSRAVPVLLGRSEGRGRRNAHSGRRFAHRAHPGPARTALPARCAHQGPYGGGP